MSVSPTSEWFLKGIMMARTASPDKSSLLSSMSEEDTKDLHTQVLPTSALVVE